MVRVDCVHCVCSSLPKKELDLPASQVLGLFNRIIRKFVQLFNSLSEVAVGDSIPATGDIDMKPLEMSVDKELVGWLERGISTDPPILPPSSSRQRLLSCSMKTRRKRGQSYRPATCHNMQWVELMMSGRGLFLLLPTLSVSGITIVPSMLGRTTICMCASRQWCCVCVGVARWPVVRRRKVWRRKGGGRERRESQDSVTRPRGKGTELNSTHCAPLRVCCCHF